MNATNALIFGALGSMMEVLPRLLPSFFPHSGGGEWSVRAVWLFIMGAVQFSIGSAYILWFHVIPAMGRLLPASGVQEPDSLALPEARGVTSR